MELKVEGAEKLGRLSKVLKEAGDKGLNRALTKGLSNAVKPLKREVTTNTGNYLPRAGGLATRVSRSRLAHRVTKGKHPRITITAKSDYRTLRDPKRVDAGRIKHPVFGMAASRAPWQVQDVIPGWFSQPLEDGADLGRREVVKVLDEFIGQVEKRI